MNLTAIREFRKLCFTTLIAVYFLILVGSIVRSSGSGMGCPDWPKCFGSWIPPTSVNELPENYKQVNAAFREKKNQKFVRYLRAVGFTDAASKMEQDKSILSESDFSPTKAWIEYANRLVGVVIGFLIILLFWRSIGLRKERPGIFYASLATLIGVIIQGWFGSIVVSSNLTTWTVSVHMFLALVIVALLVYLVHLSDLSKAFSAGISLRLLLISSMAALLIQVFLGTQVREAIDLLTGSGSPREGWISSLGFEFIVHRTFSWMVLILNALFVIKLKKTTTNNVLSLALIVIILGTLLTGVGMAFAGIPAVLQPVHLLLATGAFGIQLLLFFRLSTRQNVVLEN